MLHHQARALGGWLALSPGYCSQDPSGNPGVGFHESWPNDHFSAWVEWRQIATMVEVVMRPDDSRDGFGGDSQLSDVRVENLIDVRLYGEGHDLFHKIDRRLGRNVSQSFRMPRSNSTCLSFLLLLMRNEYDGNTNVSCPGSWVEKTTDVETVPCPVVSMMRTSTVKGDSGMPNSGTGAGVARYVSSLIATMLVVSYLFVTSQKNIKYRSLRASDLD